MTLPAKLVRAVWVCIAVTLAYALSAGGERAIAAFWIFLFWTAPFGILWRFYLYDSAPESVRLLLDDVVMAPALVILCAYLFWFVLIPKIWPKRKVRKSDARL